MSGTPVCLPRRGVYGGTSNCQYVVATGLKKNQLSCSLQSIRDRKPNVSMLERGNTAPQRNHAYTRCFRVPASFSTQFSRLRSHIDVQCTFRLEYRRFHVGRCVHFMSFPACVRLAVSNFSFFSCPFGDVAVVADGQSATISRHGQV